MQAFGGDMQAFGGDMQAFGGDMQAFGWLQRRTTETIRAVVQRAVFAASATASFEVLDHACGGIECLGPYMW